MLESIRSVRNSDLSEHGGITALAARGLDHSIGIQQHLERKDVAAELRLLLDVVDVQRDLFLVGIHLDGDSALGTIRKTLRADMHEWIVAPPSFIEIEAVLVRLAIERNKPFVIHARLTALIAGIGCKVKHVPNVRRPYIGVTLKALEHILVILGLILLGMIAAVRVCRV